MVHTTILHWPGKIIVWVCGSMCGCALYHAIFVNKNLICNHTVTSKATC